MSERVCSREDMQPGCRVSGDLYYDMLECVPPEIVKGGAFLVGEPVDHGGDDNVPRYECYSMRGTGSLYYFEGLMTRTMFVSTYML